MPTFPTAEPIAATFQLTTGDITVTASDRDDTVVDVRPSNPRRDLDVQAAEQTRVESAAGRLLVRAPRPRLLGVWGEVGSVDVTVALPSRSSVEADCSVAAFRSTGRLGDCRIKTGVGDVRLEDADTLTVGTGAGAIVVDRVDGDTDLHTGTGKIDVGSVDGALVVKNANGHNRIGTVTGTVRIKTANGDVSVESAGHDVTAATSNGDIRIGGVVRGAVSLRTGHGGIEVGIRAGTAARLDVHTSFGKVHNSLAETSGPQPVDETAEIHAHSGFGDITVRRAEQPHTIIGKAGQ